MGKILLKNKVTLLIGTTLLTISPLAVIAAAPSDFKGVIAIIANILDKVLPVIVLLAFIYFIWGLTQYIRSDKEKSPETKTVMINGLIGLFVMVCVWGFVWILTGTFISDGNVNYPSSFSTGTDWSETDVENPLQ
ncbi:MAG: hypothetical protein U9P50_02250 [Patescibacteria group bacterium]|nr:hypothetical protein [Patescibacteria group bacterium]